MDFDKKAGNWDNDPSKSERAETFASEIIRLIGDKKIDTSLEFGCGTGLVSFFLKDRFKHIILIDSSRGMIDVLNRKISEANATNMQAVLSDGLDSICNFTGIGIIYTLMVLHHIRDIETTFDYFSEILLPGGYLVIGDLYPEDGSFHGSSDFEGHFGLDPEELGKLLQSKGFSEVKFMEFYSTSRINGEKTKKYPLFFLSALKSGK